MNRHSNLLAVEEIENKTSVRYFSAEGNGTPLQHSCLENPMDGGAWWAAVLGVARVGHN